MAQPGGLSVQRPQGQELFAEQLSFIDIKLSEGSKGPDLELPLEQREFDLREEQDFEAEYEDDEESVIHQMHHRPIESEITSECLPYEAFGEISELRKKILEFQASNEQLRQENRVLQSEIEELESQIRLVKNGESSSTRGTVPEA